MSHERLQDTIRQAFAPLDGAELHRDLWPRVRERIDEKAIAVSWLDGALMAALALLLIAAPQLIPVLLYHL